LDNSTEAETNELRQLLSEVIQAAHDDEVKGKIVVGLNLTSTGLNHTWFKESTNNGSSYNNFYIWKSDVEYKKYLNLSITWGYNPDRLMYYGRKTKDDALLNYADADLKEKMRNLVLSW